MLHAGVITSLYAVTLTFVARETRQIHPAMMVFRSLGYKWTKALSCAVRSQRHTVQELPKLQAVESWGNRRVMSVTRLDLMAIRSDPAPACLHHQKMA